MSGKLFFQIVLLIIIAAVVMTATKKLSYLMCKKGMSAKCKMMTEAAK